MTQWQKEVRQSLLNSEAAALKALEKQYAAALKDINEKVKLFQADIDLLDEALSQDGLDDATKALLKSRKQSKIYQQQYQQALKGQVSGIIDKMHSDHYSTISKYLNSCYETGYIGTMYDIAKQGVPIIAPIDQAAAVKAILTDSKIVEGYYNHLGINYAKLKKTITQEISRGIASGLLYKDIARNINNVSGNGLSNAKRITRTEGHRIQQTSSRDAQYAAKKMGADVVKQWDASLDKRTRDSHARVDGEIRELDEKFSNGLMFPGDPSGSAAEVINCRCTSNTRARWALDDTELQTLKDRAEYFGLDKTKNFEDFKIKYLKAVEKSENGNIIKSLDIDDFKMMADSKDILPEVSDAIGKTIKEFESKGGMYISSARFGDFYDDVTGSAALFQVFPNQYGLVEININSRILGGLTIEEINAMIAKTKVNLPKNLEEAVAHECGHAKLIHGMSVKEVEELYSKLGKTHIEGVSPVAFSDGAECIAEVEVLLYRNDEVPKEAKALYDKYMKGKRK